MSDYRSEAWADLSPQEVYNMGWQDGNGRRDRYGAAGKTDPAPPTLLEAEAAPSTVTGERWGCLMMGHADVGPVVGCIYCEQYPANRPSPVSGEAGLRAALGELSDKADRVWEWLNATGDDDYRIADLGKAVLEARAALAASPEPGLPAEPPEHVNDIPGPHPESPDWHAGYRAGRSEAAAASTGLEELRCGCGHAKASHFPACLANVEDKPWQDFAAPFDIEKMRWGHNYVCGCPAFGSPAGTALGKRREQNRVRRELAADGGQE